MTMTPLPSPPQTSDPTNFSTKADALFAALPGFVTEANALEANVVAKETSAVSSAAAASASAISAGAAAGAAVWASGSYNTGAVAYSPSNFQTYRAKTTGSKPTDPASDPTNWAPLTADLAGTIKRVAADPVAIGSVSEYELSGFPANTRKIIINLEAVSMSVNCDIGIYIGHAGGYLTSGYLSDAYGAAGTYANAGWFQLTAGLIATDKVYGKIELLRMNAAGTKWVLSSLLNGNPSFHSASGVNTTALAAVLNKLKFFGLVGGPPLFDGGFIGVEYETYS